MLTPCICHQCWIFIGECFIILAKFYPGALGLLDVSNCVHRSGLALPLLVRYTTHPSCCFSTCCGGWHGELLCVHSLLPHSLYCPCSGRGGVLSTLTLSNRMLGIKPAWLGALGTELTVSCLQGMYLPSASPAQVLWVWENKEIYFHVLFPTIFVKFPFPNSLPFLEGILQGSLSALHWQALKHWTSGICVTWTWPSVSFIVFCLFFFVFGST